MIISELCLQKRSTYGRCFLCEIAIEKELISICYHTLVRDKANGN